MMDNEVEEGKWKDDHPVQRFPVLLYPI